MAPQNMIEAVGLTKAYGETQALAGVDFAVPAGSILGVLGPNGAGKTTAVRILTTLATPDGGRATVAGYDIAHPGQPESAATSAWPPRMPPSTARSPGARTWP